MARLWDAAIALATLAVSSVGALPGLADPLPPAAPGTAQPILDPAGRASPTILAADTDYRLLLGLRHADDWYDCFRNIPLGPNGDVRLSLSAMG